MKDIKERVKDLKYLTEKDKELVNWIERNFNGLTEKQKLKAEEAIAYIESKKEIVPEKKVKKETVPSQQ